MKVDGEVHVSVGRGKEEGKRPPPGFQSGIIATLHALQDVLSVLPEVSAEFPLPRIVVIGGQSSGKSSVLEALVGRDFLPKNKDICTRRPLVLQLTRTAKDEEWGQFNHRPGRRFTDFNDIREEIAAETTRGTESAWSVSDAPIFLKVFSPNVLSMTLVDTPGIARVPIKDQPDNIEQILSDMTVHYATPPSTLLLAVTAANGDIVNSDALKIAKMVDPEGQRTLGVLTKLDIMDEGTDVAGYLRGEGDPKLKLGFVGVVNRSQASLQRNVSVAHALRQEQAWFSNHAKSIAYREVSHLCGTRSLATKLNALLATHVKEHLQNLSGELRTKMRGVEDRLEEMGTEDVSSHASRTELLHVLLHSFETKFNALVTGDRSSSEEHLFGGAVLLHHFRVLKGQLEQAVTQSVGHSDAALLHTIHNAYGIDCPVLIPDKAFRQLVPETVRALEPPCVTCALAVHEEFQKITETALRQLPLKRFPALTLKLREVTEDVLRATLRPTMDAIQNVFHLENAYINTEHPNFVGGEEATRQASDIMRARRKDGVAERDFASFVSRPPPAGVEGDGAIRLEVREEDMYAVELTRILLRSYSGVICQTLQDIVPKTIVHFFVNQVRHSALRQAFLKRLHHPDMIAELMAEDGDLEKERGELKCRLKTCRHALHLLLEPNPHVLSTVL